MSPEEERVPRPEAVPGEVLVEEAVRRCAAVTVLLWIDWECCENPSPGASGAEQVEVVMD